MDSKPLPDPKTFYNETMPKKIGSDYEHARWHADEIREAGFQMTKDAIERHLFDALPGFSPSSVLEIGPGVGTWTKLLLERVPGTSLDLVDISAEMLRRAKLALPAEAHIRYFEGDFLAWSPDRKYQLFFSSRAVEYVGDKSAFIRGLRETMEPGAVGFIITKMPHHWRWWLLRRKFAIFHQWQMPPLVFAQLLAEGGFSDIETYVSTVNVPFFNVSWVNMFAYRIFCNMPLNFISAAFAESYCVRFRKSL